MLEKKIDRKYSDIMERAFYNTVLAGMQLDGKKFFYVNPLEVIPNISGVIPTHKHVLPERPSWYACACCPPNVARLVSSFGKFSYGENDSTCYCHLFAEGEVNFKNGVKLICETGYPYDFKVKYSIKEGEGILGIRIPGWSGKNYKIDAEITKEENGYVYINVKKDQIINLELDSQPRFVYASTKVHRLTGCVAIERGPLVYCFEGVDNGGDVLCLRMPDDAKMEVKDFEENVLGGITKIKVSLVKEKINENDDLYSYKKPETEKFEAIAIPYYTWGNRGKNQMRVWINRI